MSAFAGHDLLLPESFEPSATEVMVGRGKRCAEHPGNKRLAEIVRSHMAEYAVASTKREKSVILNKVVRIVRGNSAHSAGYVKYDKKKDRWSMVEDSAARITTAQVFRDALHTHYKSSKQFKQQRRQDQKDVTFQGRVLERNPSQASTESLSTGMHDTNGFTELSRASGVSNVFFSVLLKVLEEVDVDLSEDPFEPTPLPVSSFSFGSAALTEDFSQNASKAEDQRAFYLRPEGSSFVSSLLVGTGGKRTQPEGVSSLVVGMQSGRDHAI